MLRVVQWGTGNVGTHAMRAILERRDMQLVGAKVYNPDKVGVDVGVMLGGEPIGVMCVSGVEEVLAIDADCVNFSALGSTVEGAFDSTIELLSELLRSGRNVTSSALEHLVHPVIVPDALAALQAACEEGGSSFFDTGINPGFAMDLWPITMSRLSRTIDQVRVTEVVDMSRYDSPMVAGFMGFGLPPGDRPLDAMHREWQTSPFYASLRQVADALGFELDDVRYEREVAVAEEPTEAALGSIDPGTVAAMRMRFVGVLGGTDLLVNQWVWRVSDDVAPDWPTGDRWILEIDGDPAITSTLDLRTQLDARRPVSLAVAALNVNAIPALCAAPPGVHTNLTLPVIAGGNRRTI